MTEFFEDEKIFREFDKFRKNMMKDIFKEIQDFENSVGTGQKEGSWDVKPIRKPGVRGFVARGQWRTMDEPIGVPHQTTEQEREPLTDIFDEEKSIKIYMELPGVDKSDIQLNLTESHAEVKAKNFSKTLQLPTSDVEFEKATASYKNGVLEITVPKADVKIEDEKKKTIRIE
ncbi:MAG: Hsp20/alpha crystallin family protein [Candidatus Bathyarchaeota archaeon]|nr:Hsp20/alpha crystallin family protein [Candidatus Bathyarchaeota archaeon]